MRSQSVMNAEYYYPNQLLVALLESEHSFKIQLLNYQRRAPANKSAEIKLYALLIKAVSDLRHNKFDKIKQNYAVLSEQADIDKKKLLSLAQDLLAKEYCTQDHFNQLFNLLFPPNLDTIPEEIFENIVERLPKESAATLQQTSRLMRTMVTTVYQSKHDTVIFACGEKRTYFLCDYGRHVLTTHISDQHIIYDLLDLPKGTKIKQIAVGNIQTLGVSHRGELFAWRNQGSATLCKSDCKPQQVKLPINVAQVAVGSETKEYFYLIRTDTGVVFSAGNNKHGQLGNEVESNKTSLTRIKLDATDKAVDIAAGSFHALCCTAKGEVYHWGEVYTNKQSLPIKVNITDKVVKVSACLSHSLVLTAKGEVYCWDTQNPEPSRLDIPGVARIKQIQAGREYSLCLTSDGNVYTWKNEDRKIIHVQLPNDLKANEIASSGKHSLLTAEDGHVYAWGHNEYGQQGAMIHQDDFASIHPERVPALRIEANKLVLREKAHRIGAK